MKSGSARRWVWPLVAVAVAAAAWWFSTPAANDAAPEGADTHTSDDARPVAPGHQAESAAPGHRVETAAPPGRMEAADEARDPQGVPEIPDVPPPIPSGDEMNAGEPQAKVDAGTSTDPKVRGAAIVTQIADRLENDAKDAEARGDTERAELLRIRARRLRERADTLLEKLPETPE